MLLEKHFSPLDVHSQRYNSIPKLRFALFKDKENPKVTKQGWTQINVS
jgi:hypothetical protein